MTRLFGTDGVRGLANGHLTAELALDLSVSAAHVLAERGAFEGHRPVRRRRPRPPDLGAVPRGRRGGRPGLRRGRRAAARRAADPGRRLPHRRARRRPRRDALRLAQPDARQRHQVPRPRRRQARRRHRGRHRAAGCARPGSARPAATSAGSRRTPRPSTSTPPTWSRTDRRTRSTGCKVVLDCAEGAACEVGPAGAARRRCRGDRDPRRARRAEHQRRLRLHPPRRRCRRRSLEHGADVGLRRSTATPTAAWPSTPTATSSTATRSSRSWRWRCARPASLPTTPSWPP